VNEERILVLAPFGRDGALAAQALRAAGFTALVCIDVEELCGELTAGAGAAVLTEEALFPGAAACLSAVLAAQPPWADLPLIVFGAKESSAWRVANVTLLDRPVRIRTLISAVSAALRARRRQYEVRDLVSALEQSVRDRDQFLAMLGHELRNPLSALVTASDLIDRGAGERFELERAVIRRQLRRLSRLVDDLLDVSRVTQGKIVLHANPVDLRPLVEVTAREFRDAADARGVQMDVALGGLPVAVRGDPMRLEQIVANLLGNAVKYTPAGGRIEVTLARDSGDAVLRVLDTGIGISPEMLPRIFELFAQAPGSLDRAPGGMGIGLTLVRSLVQLHGGTVEGSSTGTGKGSQFVVRLPLVEGVELAAPAKRRQPHDDGAAAALRVVIAEDNPDARELLQFGLEQMGHRVAACADGASAIERALAEPPDAMLLDLGLPGVDGYVVARTVREVFGSRVRLVALTGYGQPRDRERAAEAGFDAFLVKPAELEVVERALRASEGQSARRTV
jgi:signal transduction histidine kinase/ActR/RegA family two-component response regulator